MQYLLYINLCGTKFQARRQKLNAVLTGYLLDM